MLLHYICMYWSVVIFVFVGSKRGPPSMVFWAVGGSNEQFGSIRDVRGFSKKSQIVAVHLFNISRDSFR